MLARFLVVVICCSALRAGPPPFGASGPAPVGASGPAPIGATGPAPLQAAGRVPLRAAGPAVGRQRQNNSTGRHRGRPVNAGYGAAFLPIYTPYVEDSPELPPEPEPAPQVGTGDLLLRQRVEELTEEVKRLRQDHEIPVPPPPPAAAEEEPSGPPLIVVLHSGEKVNVSNYAVMNGQLWDFGKHPARKIPVSSIDLPASKRATEQTGADFPL